MPLARLVRLFLVAILALCPAILLRARADDAPATVAGPFTSTAGMLLVASPDIGDPRFDKAVILMVNHDQDGAFGIVINNPVEEKPVAELLDMLGKSDPGIDGKVRIFVGGPVQPQIGFVVHSADYSIKNTVHVSSAIAVTSSATILQDIGHHKGPHKQLVAFGYAGWTSGQLEQELALNAWVTTVADPALVFDENRDTLWDKAWARRTVNL